MSEAKCVKCGTGVMQCALFRTNPIGTIPAGWMCMKCIDAVHPELAANIKSDTVQMDIIQAFENDALQRKRDFMKLPMEERQRILKEQTDQFAKDNPNHYDDLP